MPAQSWRKLGQVLGAEEGDVWSQRPSAPCIIEATDRYLMYLHFEQFSGDRRELRRIGLAEASLDDPFSWTLVGDGPLLDRPRRAGFG